MDDELGGPRYRGPQDDGLAKAALAVTAVLAAPALLGLPEATTAAAAIATTEAPGIVSAATTVTAIGTGSVLKGPIPDEIPQNLPQQIAMNAAKAGAGGRVMGQMADEPRLVANYGPGEWAKMQSVGRGLGGNITVHWFQNLTTNFTAEFKFKYIAPPYR